MKISETSKTSTHYTNLCFVFLWRHANNHFVTVSTQVIDATSTIKQQNVNTSLKYRSPALIFRCVIAEGGPFSRLKLQVTQAQSKQYSAMIGVEISRNQGSVTSILCIR